MIRATTHRDMPRYTQKLKNRGSSKLNPKRCSRKTGKGKQRNKNRRNK